MCSAGLTVGSLARITILVMGICMLLCFNVLSSVGCVCRCLCGCVCMCTRTHVLACMHTCVRNISSRSDCHSQKVGGHGLHEPCTLHRRRRTSHEVSN